MNKGKKSLEENHDEEMKYVKKRCNARNMCKWENVYILSGEKK